MLSLWDNYYRLSLPVSMGGELQEPPSRGGERGRDDGIIRVHPQAAHAGGGVVDHYSHHPVRDLYREQVMGRGRLEPRYQNRAREAGSPGQ